MNSTCKHPTTKEISTVCFTGAVAHEENRAAHGGVTITEECRNCGSQRRVNVNQCHSEEGPWGPTLAERERELAALRAIARKELEALKIPEAPAPLTLRKGNVTLAIACDPQDGIVTITPAVPHSEHVAIWFALPEDWQDAAKAHRKARLRQAELQAAAAA